MTRWTIYLKMNQVIEPTVSLNDSLYSDILRQSIFCLAISMARLIRTTRIHETVPARRIIGMPTKKKQKKKIFTQV